uniref:Movement protein BC1 n=1 Tax=Squash leaf curl China virus TaxID=223323 RepID=A0PDU4_9GEMI|nr:BC1 protein [Squash leaf curl China virus]URY16875.1 BC1 [Squash leaf curl China virus]USN24661.1 BC1 [Squash leaf curl China virus]USN24670.1 BC1 [Squash leaf curl China virus]CAJ97389.1 BC1 protein [Squash leaf curl China virus]
MSIRNDNMGIGVGGYIESDRVEYALTNDAAEVTLTFPSMFEQKISQLRNRCMKIDHVLLEYRSQVPINAVGHVVIEIHDMRLTEGDTKQAEFTIPIKCNCNLHYYSSSYFSVKDKNPWRVEYKVENTNVVNGVHFCKMLGKLKLSSAKHSTDVEFRAPRIEIQSKEFTVNDIDFWSVGSKPQTRRLVDGSRLMGHSSRSLRVPHLAIGPNESWASRSEVGLVSVTSRPYKNLSGLDESAIDPGPSASQVGSITRDEITEIITKTVEQCMKSNVNAPLTKGV